MAHLYYFFYSFVLVGGGFNQYKYKHEQEVSTIVNTYDKMILIVVFIWKKILKPVTYYRMDANMNHYSQYYLRVSDN